MIVLFNPISAIPPCAPTSPTWQTVLTVVPLPILLLAGLTFWLGYRQKEKERTLAYYHKVVVDEVIPAVIDFFTAQIKALNTAGTDGINGMASQAKAIPEGTKQALTNFSMALFQLQDVITDRTSIFDEGVTDNIRIEFQTIQDDALQWFDDIGIHRRRNVEELMRILQIGRRQVAKQIYRGQFRMFK